MDAFEWRQYYLQLYYLQFPVVSQLFVKYHEVVIQEILRTVILIREIFVEVSTPDSLSPIKFFVCLWPKSNDENEERFATLN